MRAVAAVLLAVLPFAGCGGDGGGGTTTSPDAASLQRAEARWKQHGIDDYSFRLRLRCFCPGEPRTITVTDGTAHGSHGLGSLDTVPELFTTIRHALRSPQAGEIKVSYDSRGVPVTAYIDRIERATDDELGWKIDRFRVD